MICALLVNSDGETIANEFFFSSWSEFKSRTCELEVTAVKSKSCIKIMSDNSGGNAFWGPSGVSEEPYWFQEKTKKMVRQCKLRSKLRMWGILK
ncbi:hypothetical protein N9R79_09310 [Vibrio sp.]|nr:hypothetical protein [Vibrio sp.]